MFGGEAPALARSSSPMMLTKRLSGRLGDGHARWCDRPPPRRRSRRACPPVTPHAIALHVIGCWPEPAVEEGQMAADLVIPISLGCPRYMALDHISTLGPSSRPSRNCARRSSNSARVRPGFDHGARATSRRPAGAAIACSTAAGYLEGAVSSHRPRSGRQELHAVKQAA